ncbi:RNAse (barnase) inhibitor barstar [Catenuloplanes nepalensis]|uniref:RNAse (Barnase) inhibitor barstar n=1 Tax=Catenuloplanes nepalensis TaxID=587533 RepID=A0ABT9MVS3_9ACTN|nr:barstar family protein [Catenuloplanes nepalensis]MDP9795484.1 RNAse (barnase) inhibitor barstar [Catenuloplanes nepalensis]
MTASAHVRPFLEVVVLDAVAASLRARGQRVVRLDASGWTEDDDLHRELAAALDFPEDYAATPDALRDALDDVHAPDGLALAFVGYDGFAAHRPETARLALEIIGAWCARGQQLSCLVEPPLSE